jgi:glutathione peroxidase
LSREEVTAHRLRHTCRRGPEPLRFSKSAFNGAADGRVDDHRCRYGAGMALFDTPINSLDGEPLDLGVFADKSLLIVNVASKCGLTPQYEGLERLQAKYAERGFSVLGVPCNQFGEQEPGTADEIKTFCSVNYGVTFPMTEKVEVNGEGRHPLYEQLTEQPDAEGEAGDIKWNFEKFLVAPAGQITRFRPGVEPESTDLVEAIEASLPS